MPYDEYHTHDGNSAELTTARIRLKQVQNMTLNNITTTSLPVKVKITDCILEIEEMAKNADIKCVYICTIFLACMIIASFVKTIAAVGKGVFDLRIRGITFPRRPEALVIIFSTIPTIFTVIARSEVSKVDLLEHIVLQWGVCQTIVFLDLFTRTAAIYHMIYWANRKAFIEKLFLGYRIVRYGRHSVFKKSSSTPTVVVVSPEDEIISPAPQQLITSNGSPRKLQLNSISTPSITAKTPFPSTPGVMVTDPFATKTEDEVPEDQQPTEEEMSPEKQLFFHRAKMVIPPLIYLSAFVITVPVVVAFEKEVAKDGSNTCKKIEPLFSRYYYYDFATLIAIPLFAMIIGFYYFQLGKNRLVYRLRCYFVVFILLTIPYFVLFIVMRIFTIKRRLEELCDKKFSNGILVAMTAYHSCFALKPIVYTTGCNCICCSPTCLEDHPKVDYYIEYWSTEQDKKKRREESEKNTALLGPNARAKLEKIAMIKEELARKKAEKEKELIPKNPYQRFRLDAIHGQIL